MTHRVTESGFKISASGEPLADDLEAINHRVKCKTVTGTQMQTGNTTEITIIPAVSGKTILPLAWWVDYNHAGGTDFTGAVDLEISVGGTVGSLTNGISGSSDKHLRGALNNTATHTAGAALLLRVASADPTGGHATAVFTVRVAYLLA